MSINSMPPYVAIGVLPNHLLSYPLLTPPYPFIQYGSCIT